MDREVGHKLDNLLFPSKQDEGRSKLRCYYCSFLAPANMEFRMKMIGEKKQYYLFCTNCGTEQPYTEPKQESIWSHDDDE
jgi:hypothetical protein